jgi:hypothetical protein
VGVHAAARARIDGAGALEGAVSYQILRTLTHNIDELLPKVGAAERDGFKPLGEPFWDDGERCWRQAMTKENGNNGKPGDLRLREKVK